MFATDLLVLFQKFSILRSRSYLLLAMLITHFISSSIFFFAPTISSARGCFFSLSSFFFFYYIGWVAKFITPPSRYKDLSVKANGFHYPAVYDSTTLNGLIMLYLHYGKQFVKTVLSAPPSGGAGQRLSCVLGAAVYRDISLLDGLRCSKYFENSWGNLEGSKGDLGAVKGCNSGWYSYQEPRLWPTAYNTPSVSSVDPFDLRKEQGMSNIN